MGAYDKIAINTDLEKTGVILDYTDYRVTIARAGGSNKAYQKTLEAVSRPFMRAIQAEMLDNEKADDLMKQAFARSVILNWEVPDGDGWKAGVEDPETGDVVQFNSENVLKVLRDPRLNELWVDIRSNAQKAALFRNSILEAQAGN